MSQAQQQQKKRASHAAARKIIPLPSQREESVKRDEEAFKAPGVQGMVVRLRWLMRAADVTVCEQDRLAGLTSQHSYKIDRGEMGSRISAVTLARLAEVYGCTMEWLLLGRGELPQAETIKTAIAAADKRLEAQEAAIHKIKKSHRAF